MMEGKGNGANNEEIEVFGGADCLRAEAGRGRHERWQVCLKSGISEVTLYAWRKKYAGLMPLEMPRLR